MNKKRWAFKQLLLEVEKKIDMDKLSPNLIKKLWKPVSTLEKPKRSTLDRLSLLAGFQNWDSFKETLYGDTDAQVNYEGEENPNAEKGKSTIDYDKKHKATDKK